MAEGQPLELEALPLGLEPDAVCREIRGEAHRFFRRRRRDHRLRPVRHRRHHGRGGPQDVDHDGAPTPEISRGEAQRREENVDFHDGWSSWGSRSRNLVSTVPATKPGWRMTRLRNGMVVVTPSMINESRA